MNKKQGIYAIIGMMLFCQATAGSMGEPMDVKPFVATLSIGPAWENGGKTQTFYLVPNIQKTYQAMTRTTTVASGEIFLGLERPVNHLVTGQFGLALAATSSGQLNGNVWEEANPNFNNFDYSAKANQLRVSAKGKLIANINQPLLPYVSASLGAGFNHAYDFVVTPKIVEEVPAPAFGANTTTAFTYTLGAGIQRNINQHWQVGLGYEFADWGNTTLATAPGQTLGHGLQLSPIYTQELQFYISYVA
jgi:opacity protein-like surface antigen